MIYGECCHMSQEYNILFKWRFSSDLPSTPPKKNTNKNAPLFVPSNNNNLVDSKYCFITFAMIHHMKNGKEQGNKSSYFRAALIQHLIVKSQRRRNVEFLV